MPKQSKLELKLLKEKRHEDFSHNEFHILSDLYDIEEYPNKFYKIITEKYGALDYYPGPDRLRFCKTYQWRDKGLEWIKNNLIK